MEKASEIFLVRPDYTPPTTLSEDLNRQLASAPKTATHIMVVDRDVSLYDDDWYYLPSHYPDKDIIGFHIVPSSNIFRIWESLTFWAKLHPRIRDCAVIYRKDFLDRLGGFPNVSTPGTWLARQTERKTVSPVRAIHEQEFYLSHSFMIQMRDGRARARFHDSFWLALAHSLFRGRPLVVIGYLKERFSHRES